MTRIGHYLCPPPVSFPTYGLSRGWWCWYSGFRVLLINLRESSTLFYYKGGQVRGVVVQKMRVQYAFTPDYKQMRLHAGQVSVTLEHWSLVWVRQAVAQNSGGLKSKARSKARGPTKPHILLNWRVQCWGVLKLSLCFLRSHFRQKYLFWSTPWTT